MGSRSDHPPGNTSTAHLETRDQLLARVKVYEDAIAMALRRLGDHDARRILEDAGMDADAAATLAGGPPVSQR